MTEIDSKSNHGLGKVKVRYDDGREMSFMLAASGLSPVQDKESIFAEVTPEWQAFWQQNLQFAIPADLQRPEQPGVVEAAKEASNV